MRRMVKSTGLWMVLLGAAWSCLPANGGGGGNSWNAGGGGGGNGGHGGHGGDQLSLKGRLPIGGDSGRPVVLMSHCGFDTDWWSPLDWRDVADGPKFQPSVSPPRRNAPPWCRA